MSRRSEAMSMTGKGAARRRGCVIAVSIAGVLGLAIVATLTWVAVDIYDEDNDFEAIARVTDPRTGANGAGKVRLTVGGETLTSGDDGFEAIDEPFRKSSLTVEMGQHVVVEVVTGDAGHRAWCDVEKDNLIGGDSSVSVSEGFRRRSQDITRTTCSWTRGRFD
ncbi:MAG: hypothetical protein ACRDUA_16220 [Micromonosporaceae bacterium]